MGLSINPLSLIDSYFNRRYRDHDELADFLDEVATEANVLANIWDKAIDDLQTGTGRFNPDTKTRLILDRYLYMNTGPFSRLQEFYYVFSKTVEGKLDNEPRENVMTHLGTLLVQRDLTLRTFAEAVSKINNAAFVEADNSAEDFKNLSTLSMALHKEAAALHVLAKSYRVT